MLGVPRDELMGMHPHEAGSVIHHLIVVRDCTLLQGALEGSSMLQIVETLIQCEDFPPLPLRARCPTSDIAIVLSQSMVGVGTLADIDVEFISLTGRSM